MRRLDRFTNAYREDARAPASRTASAVRRRRRADAPAPKPRGLSKSRFPECPLWVERGRRGFGLRGFPWPAAVRQVCGTRTE